MQGVWKKLGIIILLFILGEQNGIAAAITAEVDKPKTSRDDVFWLTVTVEGDLDGDVRVPESQDFEFTRTGESTNISIISGSISRERQFTYQVAPLKSGALTIPSLSAKIGGKEYSSLPIKVEVTGQGSAAPEEGKVDDKKLVFVERELPKKIFYEGESVVSTVRLLTRARLTGATPARDSAPDWRLIAVEGQKNHELVRNGVKWNAIEMREGLIPLKSGRLKVPSFGITATWLQPAERSRRHPSGSVFDLFQQGVFNMGREVTRTLRSDSTDVDVRPLPLPKPKDFADIVGAFSLSAAISKRELKPGDTATVTIEIKGQGALDRMRDLKIAPPQSKVYADRPDLKERIEPGAGLVSVRTLKFAVVPSVAGDLDLGEVRLSSFNPFTEEYEVLSTQLGIIKVLGEGALKPSGNISAPVGGGESAEDNAGAQNSPVLAKPAEVNLSPEKIENVADSRFPWLLSPWVLAIEVLVLVLVISLFLLRRSFRRDSVVSRQPVQVNPWRDVYVNREGSECIDRVVCLLKEEFCKDGQDPKALTSKEILGSEACLRMTPSLRSSLQRVLELYDLMIYGQKSLDKLPDAVFRDIQGIIDFYKNRNG